jgi:ankyrin repeat protein
MEISIDADLVPVENAQEPPPPNPQEELFTAVQKNEIDTARFLVMQEQVEVNHTNRMCKTLLFLALDNENTPMVEMLLDGKADINLPSYCHMYCTYETPVITAARLQRLDYVEMLLDRGCQLEGVVGSRVEGKTALQWAATYGNIPMAELLLKHGADVNWIGMYFHTALHYATIGDKPEMVEWLLNHGAEVGLNGDDRTALHIAAIRGNLEIVRCLLRPDRHTGVDAKDKFLFTPFSLACLRGHIGILRYMVECSGVDPKRFNISDGLLKASESGHIPVIKYLINHGADVNTCNNLGERPISIAARSQYQATQVLLEHGATIDVVDKRGYYPLQLALLRDQIDIATMLIVHGARINYPGDSPEHPLRLAFGLSNPVLLKFIVQVSYGFQNAPWFDRNAIKEKLQEADFKRQAYMRYAWETQVQKDVWSWLLHSINAPNSLMALSRIAIRDHLIGAGKGSSIVARIQGLPLPKPLIKYVLLEDIISE